MSSPTSPAAPVQGATQVARVRRASAVVLAAWAAVLVVGFAIVFTLGAPIATTGQQRDNAFDPLPVPVTEQAATDAAQRVVALNYPRYATAQRTVRQGTSGGEQIWIVTYSQQDPVSGVRITISGKSGAIRATAFP